METLVIMKDEQSVTIKQRLGELIEISESDFMINANGTKVSFDDIQAVYRERLYSLADQLGMEELYLR